MDGIVLLLHSSHLRSSYTGEWVPRGREGVTSSSSKNLWKKGGFKEWASSS